MIWLTERQSRYLIPVTMPDGYTADAALAGLIEGFDTIPDRLRRSVTFDQGPEWANWSTLAAHYSIDVWFCDPHSPWQRGQIENLNRQARWWFPRGTDLRLVTVAQAEHAANIINNQRRRSLNYRTPAKLYAALTVHRPLELAVPRRRLAASRQPGRRPVEVVVVGELAHIGAVDLHHVDLDVAVAVASE